jgi:dihydrofolate reductase
MPNVRVHVTTTLDGFMAGPNQTLERPFGDGMDHIHDWILNLKSFREMQGMGSDGETGPSDDVIRETAANLGAWILGRNMFGGGRGPWSEPEWKGWWGDTPPYHCPIFVLTHYPRPPLRMDGGTTFYFVTDGIESAMAQAKDAAAERDIRIGGGASTVNQYLAAGLVNELEVHIVPMLIGDGERLFAGISGHVPQLELIRTVRGEGVTHLKYRVLNHA